MSYRFHYSVTGHLGSKVVHIDDVLRAYKQFKSQHPLASVTKVDAIP